MRWLFIIDNWNEINRETDTTYPIMLESEKRGIETFSARIKDLAYNKEAYVIAKKLKNKNLEKDEKIKLSEFDLILIRKDPPYNLAYHYATELLSQTKTKVLNSPQSLRDFNEKLIIMNFSKFIPKTLVSSRLDEIKSFSKNFDQVVVKKLHSYQGKGVQKTNSNDIEKIAKELTENEHEAIMVQEFLPNISKGDKRVLLLGGKFLGSINRIPKKGEFRSNFGQGGKGVKDVLDKEDKKIIEKVGPWLLKQDIHFAGLDIIDGKLTEINITCPTGLQHINKEENKKLEKEVVDYFLQIIN